MTRLLPLGRALLGLCFVLDAGWYVASYDVRTAYMDAAGGPHGLIWLTAGIYAICGLALTVGYRTRLAALPLALVLLVMSVVLHTDLGPGGIGEYPPELQGEVNFKELVVHLAIIGALLLAAGHAPPAQRPDWLETSLPDGSLAVACRTGRMLVGAYFVVNALWQWYYFDIRVEHIVASGGNPAVLPFVIAIQILGGALVASGVALWLAVVPLAVVLVVSTVLVHGNLSETAPYPPNVQVHQWFVKAAILAGLILVLGETARPRPTVADGGDSS